MKHNIVRLLVLKDWYLNRWLILGSLASSALALGVIIFTGKAGFYIGTILLVTVLVVAGAQLAISSVITERKEQNLAFIMSLPISFREYTLSKILANVLIFLVPWTIVLSACLIILLAAPGATHGLVPYVTIMCAYLLVSTCFILCVTLTTESQGWATAAIIASNVGFNVVGYLVAHIPPIAATMFGPKVMWDSSSVGLLFAEFAAVLLLLALTFFVQSRKTDFC
jgi:ABC-2 type transport system permease protein